MTYPPSELLSLLREHDEDMAPQCDPDDDDWLYSGIEITTVFIPQGDDQ